MKSVTFSALHPVLAVRDVGKAVRFYVERLGFRVAFQDRTDSPLYVGVRRDDVEMHLQWHDEVDFKDVEAGTLMLRLLVSDVDALFEEYRDKDVFHEGTQLRNTPWRTREFAFFDLDGHGLIFCRDSPL